MTNHLGQESSPYLRDHADDPVDWYPWGPEAFERARVENKPVFISIGYASCHWCHVMHRESFLDKRTAKKLNESFVSVKVDREARPDVDEHYMAYVVAVTGQGGWPMTVITTPDLVPIYGGTYFPPQRAQGIPAFGEVLDQLSEAFANDNERVVQVAEESLEYVRSMFAPLDHEEPSSLLVARAAQALIRSTDFADGGFSPPPKFPQAPVADFLLAYSKTGNEQAAEAVETTIERMIRGGIYDQMGGGVSRYSTDDVWLVPHFEKMLYDNAQLLTTLARLHEVRPRAEWVHAMRQTADFLSRDLRVDGAYASSLDADTNGVEGSTYLWDYDELKEALTLDELALAQRRLGVTPGGNWRGFNIITRDLGRAEDAQAVDSVLNKLLRLRQQRPQPRRDDKIVVAWNALAAIGLLDAGFQIGDANLADQGIALVQLLLDEAVDSEGGVRRLLSDPASSDVRVLEDAATLSIACSRIAQVADPTFGQTAELIFDKAVSTFYDGNGTWYSTPEQTPLPVRPRDQHDNPTPSGQSLAARAALLLQDLTGDNIYNQIAEKSLGRQVPMAKVSPSAAGSALLGMLELEKSLART